MLWSHAAGPRSPGNWDGLTFSPDGTEVAAEGTRVVVWDAPSGRVVYEPDEESLAGGIAYVPGTDRLSFGTQDGRVETVDPRTGDPVGSSIHASGGVIGIVYSPDAQLVALATLDKTVSLWDAASGLREGTIPRI